MRGLLVKLSALASLTIFLASCGGTGAVGGFTPLAEGQKYGLSNVSSATVHNLIQATGTLGTSDVLYLNNSAGTVTMTTRSPIASANGQTVSLRHFAQAMSANDGSYTLTSVDNLIQTYPTYQFSCAGCVNYQDFCCGAVNNTSGTVKAMDYDAFPTMVKDQSNLLRLIYYQGCDHTNCPATNITFPNAQTGGSVMEMTSPDGITWSSTASKIFWDSGNHCQGNTIPCDWENGATGVTAAGVPFAWAIEFDWGGAGNLGNFSKTYQNGAWSANPVALAGNSPAGNAWNISFGNCNLLNGTPYCAFVDVASKTYLVPFCGDGTTTCGNGIIHLTAPGYAEMPTNECAPISVDGKLKAIVFCRTNKLVNGNCAVSPCANLLILTTSDLSTFTANLSPLTASIATTTVELVAPFVAPSVIGHALLVYGERDATSSRVMAVDLDLNALFGDFTALAVPQMLATTIFNDATYPSVGFIGGTAAVAFYHPTNASGQAKIFTASAQYQSGQTLVLPYIRLKGIVH